MVRPFVPVFERLEETYVPTQMFGRSGGYQMLPRFEPGEVCLYCSISPTSIPKKLWSIRRVRVRRAGQLELIKV